MDAEAMSNDILGYLVMHLELRDKSYISPSKSKDAIYRRRRWLIYWFLLLVSTSEKAVFIISPIDKHHVVDKDTF